MIIHHFQPTFAGSKGGLVPTFIGGPLVSVSVFASVHFSQVVSRLVSF